MTIVERRYKLGTTALIVALFAIIGLIMILRFSGLLLQPLSNNIREVTPGNDSTPTLALNRLGDGNQRLEVLDPASGQTRLVLSPSHENVVSYRWAPNKSLVVYVSQALIGNPSETPELNVWKINIDGSGRSHVAAVKTPQLLISVNNAATHVALATTDHLSVVGLTENQPKPVNLFSFPAVAGNAQTSIMYVPEPVWTTDDQAIIIKTRAATYFNDNQTITYKINAQTGAETVIARGADNAF